VICNWRKSDRKGFFQLQIANYQWKITNVFLKGCSTCRRSKSDLPRLIKIFLASHCVSFAHKRRKLIIQLRLVAQTEVMHTITRSERIDAMEERRFNSPLQPQRAFHPSLPHHNVGESPAGLKSYAALLRVDPNRAASFDEFDVFVEQLAERRVLASEVIFDWIVAAGM